MKICKICGNSSGNKSYFPREMLFGWRDEFEYFECAKCKTLQIREIPDNISKYYPENYYSFKKQKFLRDGHIASFLRRQRAKYYLYRKNLLGLLMSKMTDKPICYDWFNAAKVEFDSEILDVGCGRGQLLHYIRKEGFFNLTGVDPFIDSTIFYENGVRVYKKDLTEIKKQFDFIMLNHSFEHMEQPLSALKKLYCLLKPDRYLLIRIPIVSSYAWQKYGINWVSLDAPRHFFLYTPESIRMLSDKVGFQISDVVFDSTEFQFWGSEQYINNIPMLESTTDNLRPKESFFSKKQIEDFKGIAAELNKKKKGDTAAFYLYKTKKA